MEDALIRKSLKAPRAGAIAGIAFSLLLFTALVLIRSAVPANPEEAHPLLPGGWRQVQLALSLLPFAGIAFLWFMGVLRDRMGALEDKFFATVFLGSGLLFLAMLFSSAAVAGTLLMLHGTMRDQLVQSGLYSFGRTVAYQLMNVYAMKMAGVFMISTCTIAVRIKFLPGWLAVSGYGAALLLLLTSGRFSWSPLVFPFWALLVGVHVLLSNLRTPRLEGGGPQSDVPPFAP